MKQPTIYHNIDTGSEDDTQTGKSSSRKSESTEVEEVADKKEMSNDTERPRPNPLKTGGFNSKEPKDSTSDNNASTNKSKGNQRPKGKGKGKGKAD